MIKIFLALTTFILCFLYFERAQSGLGEVIRFNEEEVDYFEYKIDPKCIDLKKISKYKIGK